MNKEKKQKIVELDRTKISIKENILSEERIIDMYKENYIQIQEAISEKTKMLESLKCKLNSAVAAIPDFDIEIYNLYKEYAVLESRIQQENEGIDKLHAEIVDVKFKVAKAEQILAKRKTELQMIETELEIELENLKHSQS